jgi:hypothetical protein
MQPTIHLLRKAGFLPRPYPALGSKCIVGCILFCFIFGEIHFPRVTFFRRDEIGFHYFNILM